MSARMMNVCQVRIGSPLRRCAISLVCQSSWNQKILVFLFMVLSQCHCTVISFVVWRTGFKANRSTRWDFWFIGRDLYPRKTHTTPGVFQLPKGIEQFVELLEVLVTSRVERALDVIKKMFAVAPFPFTRVHPQNLHST